MKNIIIAVITLSLSYHTYASGLAAGGIASSAGAASAAAAAAGAESLTWYQKLKGHCSNNPVFCAMAAASLIQAGISIADAMKSRNTSDSVHCTGSFCGAGTGLNDGGAYTNNNGGNGSLGIDPVLGELHNDVQNSLNELSQRGYTFKPDTNSIETPVGSMPVSSLGSTEGLKGLGMSNSDLEELANIKAAVASELANKLKSSKFAGSADYDTAGGGGSKLKPGPGYGEDKNAFDMNKYLASLMNKNKHSRGVAGLEKKLGSDSIGVAQDNIFNMIHRRYEAKKTTLNH